MATTHDERFAQIEQTYFDANNNYASDREKAPPDAQKGMVDANRNAAYEAYNDALAKQLSESGDAVEQAYSDLRTANQSVKQARADLIDIVNLIDKLGTASAKAKNLLDKAAEQLS